MSSSRAESLAARLIAPNRNRDHSDDDDDALFAELEEELENADDAAVRERAFQAIRKEVEYKQNLEASNHGKYTEVTDEKEVIQITAREPRCVVHFYHSNFKRCEIMDIHLAKLAPRYFHTRFFRVFVENIPWLVEKLEIKVLPCVVAFVDGVTKDRLVGFEELGNSDKFDTAVLELRLAQSEKESAGVIQKPKPDAHSQLFKVKSSRADDDDEIFDL